jgi:SAM-dependent methyltransferase
MSVAALQTNGAVYDVLAPHYDVLTSGHDYELWVGALLAAVDSVGLRGHAVLDVGCGTGKSSQPFMDRGFEVTGLDASAGMLRVAARRAPDARLVQGDMRDLPVLGRFDLVVCLDDGMNYLDGADELTATFNGIRRNLRPGGLLLFDTNTVHAYREHFASTSVAHCEDDLVLLWRGQAPPNLQPGEHAELVIDAFVAVEGGWERQRSHHTQRHHPDDEVRDALQTAGLRLVDTAGHGFDAVLERPGDPARHNKLIYIAQREELPGSDHKEVKEQCCPSSTPASRWPPRHPSSREADIDSVRAASAARTTPPHKR